MISNINRIASYNGGSFARVSPNSYDDGGFDMLFNDDDASFSINTLRSNLSLPSLDEADQMSMSTVHQVTIPEGVFVTPSREDLSRTSGNSFDGMKPPYVVKSPFLDRPLPIPRFNYDDISAASMDESQSAVGSLSSDPNLQPLRRSKRQRKPVDLRGWNLDFKFGDVSITLKDKSHAADGSLSSDYDSQPLRRSLRERKPVDLRRRNLDFIADDMSISSNGESHATDDSLSSVQGSQPLRRSKRERKPVDLRKRNLDFNEDDVSIALRDAIHAVGGSLAVDQHDNQPLRRSTRQRKAVDLQRRNLEAPASDSSSCEESANGVHPCSAGGKLRSIYHSTEPTNTDNSDDEDSSVADGRYAIQDYLERRIKENKDGVPLYEYLIQWKPTWEPEAVESLGKNDGAWNLEKILERRLKGGTVEVKCQWAASWEPEDSLGDEALRAVQKKFRDGNNTNSSGDPGDDDGNNDHETAGEKYIFDGKVFGTYMEMVEAKRERNKSVLRRIMSQRMNECDNDRSNDAVA